MNKFMWQHLGIYEYLSSMLTFFVNIFTALKQLFCVSCPMCYKVNKVTTIGSDKKNSYDGIFFFLVGIFFFNSFFSHVDIYKNNKKGQQGPKETKYKLLIYPFIIYCSVKSIQTMIHHIFCIN